MIGPTLTLTDGANITVRGEHLVILHGYGPARHEITLSRGQRDVQRLLILDRMGSITIPAMLWLAQAGITWSCIYRVDGHHYTVAYSMLESERPRDALLRRSQAYARDYEYGAEITRRLLMAKLDCQQMVARDLGAIKVSDDIARKRATVEGLPIAECFKLEGHCARQYFSAWQGQALMWEDAVPAEWEEFEMRDSRLAPKSRSPRFADHPINALLNFGYKVLESATTEAIHAMGLDPLLGISHLDKNGRDSLACDLMEPGRPWIVDDIVVGLIKNRKFSKRDFSYGKSGVVGLKPALASELASDIFTRVPEMYRVFEDVLNILVDNQQGGTKKRRTPLTGRNRSDAQWAQRERKAG